MILSDKGGMLKLRMLRCRSGNGYSKDTKSTKTGLNLAYSIGYELEI